MSAINQKEYLKKYLGIGKSSSHKKKHKKKDKSAPKSGRIQVIDDDLPMDSSNNLPEDPFAANEDAPQIVAIIDERPPSMRIDDRTKDNLWQPIGGPSNNTLSSEPKERVGFKLTSAVSKPNEFYSQKSKSLNLPTLMKHREVERPIGIIDDEDESQSLREKSPIVKLQSDDYSPPRKRRASLDHPKKNSDDNSPPRKNTRIVQSSSRKIDDDISPVRPSRDISPPRKKKNDDISPSRKPKHNNSSIRNTSEAPSPPRRRKRDETDTPPSKDKRSSRWEENDVGVEKMKKTLDGKSAGLQNAKELVEETRKFKERENNIFENMSKQISGENAKTIRRDRKTGKIRNLEEEEEHQRKKREAEDKNKEKYSKWGRGLVQVESRNRRVQEELYEMSKPLARYADDKDLESYLKDQEREGDPMLAYIRSKKRKDAVKSGVPEKPQYLGDFTPNRFGIRPGHRWDGVDRSSGYEKKWFEVQNEKRAAHEDNYKWSTEDM